MSSDVDKQQGLALRRITRVSGDWTARGVDAPTLAPAPEQRDGLIAHGPRTGPYTLDVPSTLWSDLPAPKGITLTSPEKTPPLIAGLLTWYGNHPHPPVASRYFPYLAADDNHVLAATMTVTGCAAAHALAKGTAYRKAWVACLIPHLLRTLTDVLHAPPALPVALLTALTQSRIVTSDTWEDWALRRLGEDGLLDARELGYEAAAITATDRHWVRDLIVETARRSRPTRETDRGTNRGALGNQRPCPEASPPASTETQNTPPNSDDDRSNGSGEREAQTPTSGLELPTPDSGAREPSDRPSTESRKTSDDDRSAAAEANHGRGDTPSAPRQDTASTSADSTSPAPPIGGAEGSPESMTGRLGAPEEPRDTTARTQDHQTSEPQRAGAPEATPDNPAPGTATRADDTSRAPAPDEGAATTDKADNSLSTSNDDRSDPNEEAKTEGTQRAQNERHNTTSQIAPSTPATSNDGMSNEAETSTNSSVPEGILAAARDAVARPSNRVRIPKPRPSQTQLDHIQARRTRDKDRDKGRHLQEKVFPPGTPSPIKTGDRTTSPTAQKGAQKGKGKSASTILWRTPTPEEKRTSRRIATALRKAKVRAPSITDYWSIEPPGRIDMRMAMQEEALHELGMDIEVPIFQQTRIEPAPEPELSVGFCIDVSGSMQWATEAAPSIAWCILSAVNAIGGRTCAVRFGGGVHPLFSPGKVPNLVPTIRTAPVVGHDYTEALHVLDSALRLQSTPNDEVAKLIFVFSDGKFGAAQETTGYALAERLHRRAGVRFIWVAFPPASPRAPSEFLTLEGSDGAKRHDGISYSDLYDRLPKMITAAVVDALRNHRTRRPQSPGR